MSKNLAQNKKSWQKQISKKPPGSYLAQFLSFEH